MHVFVLIKELFYRCIPKVFPRMRRQIQFCIPFSVHINELHV